MRSEDYSDSRSVMKSSIISVKVHPHVGLALKRSRMVVNPQDTITINIDVDKLTNEQLESVAESVDPDGSGKMSTILFTERGILRQPGVPLRAWPLNSAGVLEALDRCNRCSEFN